MSGPRVPLTVEGLTALRARYAAAVADVIDQLDVLHGAVPQPSADPRHVFDTPDGWRLIVSCERLPDGRVGVHLSASVHDHQAVARAVDREDLDGLLDAIVRSWRFIANSERTPTFIGFTDGAVPHFFLERAH